MEGEGLVPFLAPEKVHKPLFSSTLWDTHLACGGSISLIGYVSPTIFASLPQSILQRRMEKRPPRSFSSFLHVKLLACITQPPHDMARRSRAKRFLYAILLWHRRSEQRFQRRRNNLRSSSSSSSLPLVPKTCES